MLVQATISRSADSDRTYVTFHSDMDLMSNVIIEDILVSVLSHNISVSYRVSDKSGIIDLMRNI
jgi:hypothetical protein